MARKGIGSHHSARSQKEEWLTDPKIIASLGSFDLDPCAPVNRPWDMAKNHYTILDDGLKQEWNGRVWCNPPYGLKSTDWLRKLSDHQNGTALIFGRTDTNMFFDQVWDKAESFLFIRGRLHFYHMTGERATHNSGAPSVLVSYNEFNSEMLEKSGIVGKHLPNHPLIYVVGLQKTEKTWRVVVGEAIAELNSKATIQEIYQKVLEIAPIKTRANKHFKEKIRQTLGRYFERVEPGQYSNQFEK